MRLLFIAFCIGIVSIAVVAGFLKDEAGNAEPAWRSIVIVALLGCASIAGQSIVPKPLDCSSTKALAASYRTRFLLRLAMSEVVGLAALVIALAWGPWWTYFVGAAFTLVGFARLAPTRRHLQLDQDRLSLAGCTLSLTAALRTKSS